MDVIRLPVDGAFAGDYGAAFLGILGGDRPSRHPSKCGARW
jgi:hypothetical protein